jgi:malignant T-cell-amplified sequence
VKRQVASKHDSRDYIEKIQASSGIKLDVPRSAQVETIEPEEGLRFIVVDGKYTFVQEQDGSFVPYVGSQQILVLLPSVYIDEGAIRYILKGADVMRPGIVKYDEWGEKGRLVVVRDEKKGRGLAVGRSLVGSSGIGKMDKGDCVENLHHAGDHIWDSYKKI